MSDEGSPLARRHSKADGAQLISDPDERAQKEAENGLKQFDAAMQLVEMHLSPERPFRLRPSAILELHRMALDGIHEFAGNYRPAAVSIQESAHQPVERAFVPHLVEEMCDYVNAHWADKSAVHLAAYVMWRLNWIHPFADGNGRTSRVVSYLVLCIKLGARLPGRKAIPDQICDNRDPYFKALESADEAAKRDEIDVSAMEALLEGLLAKQLLTMYEDARH
jgi:Fic family protein